METNKSKKKTRQIDVEEDKTSSLYFSRWNLFFLIVVQTLKFGKWKII
jgi:hypothetical protein